MIGKIRHLPVNEVLPKLFNDEGKFYKNEDLKFKCITFINQ